MKWMRVGLVLAGALLSLAPPSANAAWMIGSTYDLTFTNFPVNAVVNGVTLDLTTKVVNTDLTVTETIYPDGPGAQWIDFYFETVNGGPLASNINANWRIDINGVDVTVPSMGDGFYYYWTINDAPVNPISPFGGFGTVAPIPTNPGLGPAYVATGFPPYGPQTVFGAFAFANPYNFISSGGMNPSQVNGFHVGIRAFEYNAVPEPASLISLGIGLGLMGLVVARRRSARPMGT